MEKFFNFVRNFIQFIKIILIFSLLMLLLYWIEKLSDQNWSWISFMVPLLDGLIDIGSMFSKDSIEILGAAFEYKYMWAAALLLVLFGFMGLLQMLSLKIQDICEDANRSYKKLRENEFNKNMTLEHEKEQKLIKKYKVYISTSVKKNTLSLGESVNLDEQNKIMNKFLMEKFNITPVRYGNGFLYSFDNFNTVDYALEILFKVLKSTAPVDYTICLEICEKSSENINEKLDALIDLQLKNKICTLSDTVFRYSYNDSRKYETSQVGVFQKGSKTIEVSEFVEN